ncbi:MAG: hypothetical protein MUO77_17035, partial [Anaerolineales bacterium]|nr:hypothetical protein [Anaerolineales bacterium]
MNNKFSPPFDDALLKSLAQRVDDHRADLINRCQQVLHETLLTNRSEMRSDELARIATAEADALIYSLRNSLSFVKEHGAALCEMGLSRQTVFGLLRAIREFLIAHFENDFVALNIYTSYHIMALDGFLESNEKRILSEQEGIRHAFQIALDNSTAKISESEERYRSLVELSPVRSEAFIRSINDSLVSGMIYQIYRMKDGSRKFTYLSDSVQRMYGITPQDGMENSDLIYGRVHKE